MADIVLYLQTFLETFLVLKDANDNTPFFNKEDNDNYYVVIPEVRIRVQGRVVQSIVSFTSSLRGQLVKCFMTL